MISFPFSSFTLKRKLVHRLSQNENLSIVTFPHLYKEVVMDYITMVFDIKDSRHYPNRALLQYTLIDLLKQCNTQFKDILAAPFIITLGDEWQGLLKPNSDYRCIIQFFKLNLPQDLSFCIGVGIGPITISNFELTVNQLDGPAFYLAREAINYAKRKKHQLVVLSN